MLARAGLRVRNRDILGEGTVVLAFIFPDSLI